MTIKFTPFDIDMTEGSMLKVWSSALHRPLTSCQLIAQTQHAAVYRLRGQMDTYVAKVGDGTAEVEREITLNSVLDSAQVLLDARPHLLAECQLNRNRSMIFTDEHLRPIVNGLYTIDRTIRLLTRLHRLGSSIQLPEACTSHTPQVQAIIKSVSQLDDLRLRATLKICGIGLTKQNRILQLFHFIQEVDMMQRESVTTICHGDAHLKNFMWSHSLRRMYLIDWEFVHYDSPYFDLFQLIDATSPVTPLLNHVPRLQVLMYYTKWMFGASKNRSRVMVRKWYTGYLQFAALHLFWILQRIWVDLESQRFSSLQLRRQQLETFGRLASIAYSLKQL